LGTLATTILTSISSKAPLGARKLWVTHQSTRRITMSQSRFEICILTVLARSTKVLYRPPLSSQTRIWDDADGKCPRPGHSPQTSVCTEVVLNLLYGVPLSDLVGCLLGGCDRQFDQQADSALGQRRVRIIVRKKWGGRFSRVEQNYPPTAIWIISYKQSLCW